VTDTDSPGLTTASRPPAAAAPEPTAKPVEGLGYSEAAAELDRIIAELDRGVIDVDVLEVRLCRAVEIVEELDRRIRGARERVNAILPRLESAGRGEAAADGPATV
jgi:exonuclease VII small subunit